MAEDLVLEIDLHDSGFSAKPHRIIRTEKGCIYDEQQRLEEFYARSKTHDALLKGDKAAKEEFEQLFSNDCKDWLIQFLLTFRGIDPEIAKQRKELSP